jgi:hypothetical protein
MTSLKLKPQPSQNYCVQWPDFEQRPPANNGQPKAGQIKLIAILIENPLKSGHLCTTTTFWGVPKVAVVDRFDCIIKSNFQISFLFKLQVG